MNVSTILFLYLYFYFSFYHLYIYIAAICCSGLLRDISGAWICGFAMKIGRASAIVAEIWGVFEGLKLAREKGYRYVEV